MLYALAAALVWSVILNHITPLMHMLDHGLGWLITSRSADERPEQTEREARVERAWRNHQENLMIFAPLALVVLHTGHGQDAAAIALGWTWCGARVGHMVCYMLGIVPLRSLMHTTCLLSYAGLGAVALGWL